MLTRYVKPMEHDRGNGRSLLAWRPQSIVKIRRLNTVPNVRFRSKRLLTRLKTIKNNDEDDKKITIRTICGKRILMEANITERRATIKSTCENWHKQNKINHRAHVSVPFSRVTWSLSRGSVMWHLWQFPPQMFQGRLHDSSFVIYLLNPWLKLNIKENTSVVGGSAFKVVCDVTSETVSCTDVLGHETRASDEMNWFNTQYNTQY